MVSHRFASIMALACCWFLLTAELSFAQNETPSSDVAYILAPLRGEGDQGEDQCIWNVGTEGGQYYLVGYLPDSVFDLDPPLSFLRHMQHIDGSEPCGVHLYTGHGNPYAILMDCFSDTNFMAAQDACNQRLQYYGSLGYITSAPNPEIAAVLHGTAWTIEMFNQAVRNRGNMSAYDPLIYLGCCSSDGMADEYPPKGARVALGYHLDIMKPDNRNRIDTFFSRLNGVEGQAKRRVADARVGLAQLVAYGDQNTTLAPSVTSVSAPLPFEVGDTVAVTFDTKCDTWCIPDLEGTFCAIANEVWVTPTLLRGTCTSTSPPVASCFALRLPYNSVFSANSSARLDGNTNPIGANAHGPAWDDFTTALADSSDQMHKQSSDGYRPPDGNPEGTDWSELHPGDAEEWELMAWFDDGDYSFGAYDTAAFLRQTPYGVRRERIDIVTPTICVQEPGPTFPINLELIAENPSIDDVTDPLGTYWVEINPYSCAVFQIVGWQDNWDGQLGAYDEVEVKKVSQPDSGISINYDVLSFETGLISTVTCQGRCGNANGSSDGKVNAADATYLINFVFVPGSPAPVPVMECGNANSSSDGKVNVADATYIINFVFAPGSPAPGNCYPATPGPDCCPY